MPEHRLLTSAVSAGSLAAPILIIGSPRSGTTWLAKIIDSHPDVLYRHEPDATRPGPSPLTPDAVAPLLARWAADRSPRTVTKQPFFAKSWQPGWLSNVRRLLAVAVSVGARLPAPLHALGDLAIPDLAAHPAPRVAIKSVAWADGAAMMAGTLPASRTIFILRHPCGQVASVMRGARQLRFDLNSAGTDMPFDEAAAVRFAASFGIGESAFQALLDAAKYAWSWRAFNEPAYASLATRSNVAVVVYENLCAEPQTSARRIMDFAGLAWNRQSEDFIVRSTAHHGEAGYYAIFRDAVAAAENWRNTMPRADQAAVRTVMTLSPLARLWPDLTNPT